MKMKTDSKRQAILDVAAEAFREIGFGVSMSEITARVGGSKATIYNYFSSKEELFFEVMFRATEAEFDAVHHSIDLMKDDTHESLRHFGERLLTFLYSPQIRAQRHLAISESGRTELGRLMYERGVLRNQNLIAEFLREAMSLGKLRQADPSVASQHLCSLLESELLDRFLYQLPVEVSAEEIKAVTERAVAVFIAAYGSRV
ncbi:MAG: TetR/AcrR family transcriptional regulator [Desulfuromonadales bacterium]|nr:TetR/AcrR family transcriptional regulator [Desulfuromonadales bacterium]